MYLYLLLLYRYVEHLIKINIEFLVNYIIFVFEKFYDKFLHKKSHEYFFNNQWEPSGHNSILLLIHSVYCLLFPITCLAYLIRTGIYTAVLLIILYEYREQRKQFHILSNVKIFFILLKNVSKKISKLLNI